jgi:hypothetical protein
MKVEEDYFETVGCPDGNRTKLIGRNPDEKIHSKFRPGFIRFPSDFRLLYPISEGNRREIGRNSDGNRMKPGRNWVIVVRPEIRPGFSRLSSGFRPIHFTSAKIRMP